MLAGHGPNIGHGYVKYVIIDQAGQELAPIVFPAMIARSASVISGSLVRAETVQIAGGHYWTGEDALLAPSPLTMLAQDRLADPAFIPALVRGALDRFGYLNGTAGGACVTGLPATWAADVEKAKLLGQRLREASTYQQIRVIPEPLGLIYAALLDNDGQIAGDPALQAGRIGVVDLGHHTVDIAVIQRLVPVPASLDTYHLGTARPLGQIRARLSAYVERELTLYETDQAIRAGGVRVAGRTVPLPPHWDDPIVQNADAIVARLVDAWGSGASLDAIVLGGGGAELEQLELAIRTRFPHAYAVPQPQIAIARGYARLARRLATERR